MPDIFLYDGEANRNDIRLRDPTESGSAVNENGSGDIASLATTTFSVSLSQPGAGAIDSVSANTATVKLGQVVTGATASVCATNNAAQVGRVAVVSADSVGAVNAISAAGSQVAGDITSVSAMSATVEAGQLAAGGVVSVSANAGVVILGQQVTGGISGGSVIHGDAAVSSGSQPDAVSAGGGGFWRWAGRSRNLFKVAKEKHFQVTGEIICVASIVGEASSRSGNASTPPLLEADTTRQARGTVPLQAAVVGQASCLSGDANIALLISAGAAPIANSTRVIFYPLHEIRTRTTITAAVRVAITVPEVGQASSLSATANSLPDPTGQAGCTVPLKVSHTIQARCVSRSGVNGRAFVTMVVPSREPESGQVRKWESGKTINTPAHFPTCSPAHLPTFSPTVIPKSKVQSPKPSRYGDSDDLVAICELIDLL